MFNLAQIKDGTKLVTHPERDDKLTPFSKETLKDRYLMPGESFQDRFANVALAYADDSAHAQRIYDYMSNLWFMPSTPVLSNGGTERGLPISCYLNEADDGLEPIVQLWNENVWLASKGGGIGSFWGNIRSIGERVGKVGKTSGIIPFIKVTDSLTLAISQGSLRRGSAACYLQVSHPEIEEFIEMRRPTGGDPNRKALNLHHGVVISDAFMRAVEVDEEWPLISPKDQSIVRRISARNLWIRMLTTRLETGEPYMLFIDHVNKAIPEHHKLAGLNVKTSNLCSEITLPTGKDHCGKQRTAVCCLSSVNLEYFQEWENHPTFIEDCTRFLDNVLTDYIKKAPEIMKNATYAASRERSIGLGVMGFHSFLQKMGIPFESVMAKVWNNKMFAHIKGAVDKASKLLADEKGPCPDAAEYGIQERFSNKMAVAPTASISIIAGGASPGIEPIVANAFTHKTLSGSTTVTNKFLKKILLDKGKDTDEIWSLIMRSGGSVKDLDFLSQDEKDVFKTAFEIDQRWIIDLAADRTPYICQAQSLNVFLPANVHKKELHHIHYRAWKKGVKSLYYCRSQSLQRAETGLDDTFDDDKGKKQTIQTAPIENVNYEECLSCQ